VADRITEDEDGQLVVTTPLLVMLNNIQRDVAAGFAGLQVSLDGKADKADLAKLEGRWESLNRRVEGLETSRHDREIAATVHQQRDQRTFTKRQKVWGVAGAVALLLATVGGPILAVTITH
jgi:hypothetical protein